MVVLNFLCVRELLKVLAAKVEQGELGSDWCSGSWALRVFRGVLDLRCAVHVLGGFCGRECGFGVCRPCFGWFLWTGVGFWGVPSTFWEVFVDGSVVFGRRLDLGLEGVWMRFYSKE